MPDLHAAAADQTGASSAAGAGDPETGPLHGVRGGPAADVPVHLPPVRPLVRPRLVLDRHQRARQGVQLDQRDEGQHLWLDSFLAENAVKVCKHMNKMQANF